MLGLKLNNCIWNMQIFEEGRALTVNDSFDLLSFPDSIADAELNQKLRDVLPRLDFHIEYECFYGDRFTMET